MPALTVVGPDASDARLGLVDEAISYWNRTFQELDSGFRLGAVTRRVAPVPDEALQSLSQGTLARTGGQVPPALSEIPGDIVVALADADFVSFVMPFAGGSRMLVGIKGLGHAPFIFPNVARNVIAHELGVKLGHVVSEVKRAEKATEHVAGKREKVAKVEKTEKPEKPEKLEKPAKPEKPGR